MYKFCPVRIRQRFSCVVISYSTEHILLQGAQIFEAVGLDPTVCIKIYVYFRFVYQFKGAAFD